MVLFLASILADFFVNRELSDYFIGAAVIPVPMRRKKLRTRGFNQAELIAQSFARACDANIETSALRRIRHSRPQSMIADKKERERNVAGCFAADEESVAGRDILLIDDVSTSGSTFREAALALKRAGSGRIIALAAALA